MRSGRKTLKLTLVLLAVAVPTFSRTGHAYNSGTHHGIVGYGWQVMRAASDPAFGDHIAWRVPNVSPPTPGSPPPPLSHMGSCAMCGPDATTQRWADFLAKIPASMAKLNTLDPGLSVVPCTGTLTSDGTLGGMLVAFGTNPDLTAATDACGNLGNHLQGGAYDGNWHPGGIFDMTNPNPAIDGNGYQGLMLGYHAKTGDDHIDDTVFETLWIAAAIVAGVVIGALLILGVISVGGLLLFAAGVIIAVVALAILFCIAGLLDGDGCGNGIVNGFTHLVEAAHAPATALDNTFPEINGIIPRGGDIKDSTYTGLWHYINAKSSGSNSYDDRQGMYYDEAGPDFPGQFDFMIMAGLDLGDLHLGYDESDGPHHYEIRGANDGHTDSEHRSFAKWQGPTGAHLQFSPLDNFGFYGWKNFLTSHDAHWLSWPLHALGDATVPMHVMGTSSWGHRPYEDSLDWGEKWNAMRWLRCVPESLGDCTQKCFADPADPTKTCPEATNAVDNSRKQFEQARTILQHAFRWSRFIQAWRDRTGRPGDIPVRDMITQLALETASLSNQNGGDNSWPWCDDCSMEWVLPGILGGGDNHQGMNFYQTDDSLAKERDLIERSVGATLAFLVATADAVPATTCSTGTCAAGATCCGGKVCSGGSCCTPGGSPCEHDRDCCGSAGNPSVCRNRICVTAASNTCQTAGSSCEDGSAACCADGNGAKQCGLSANGVSICCNGTGASCKHSYECCGGSCKITSGDTGVCQALPVGSSCSGAQCEAPAECQDDGTPVSAGGRGVCCNPSTTGSLDCDSDADCCTGLCLEVADDVFKCRCAPAGGSCTQDNDCCAGNSCQNGTCRPVCHQPETACQNNAQCCTGVCCATVTGGPVCRDVCACVARDGACQKDSDCCTGNSCISGSCRPPCIATGELGCEGNGDCCSDRCENAACVCGEQGAVCQNNAQCCTGKVCCASLGFVCASDCPTTCQGPGGSCQSNSDCCAGNLCCANFNNTCHSTCEVVR